MRTVFVAQAWFAIAALVLVLGLVAVNRWWPTSPPPAHDERLLCTCGHSRLAHYNPDHPLSKCGHCFCTTYAAAGNGTTPVAGGTG